MTTGRLDSWLWAVRLCKTRQIAATACRLQRVRVAGQPAKPARSVRPGDIVQFSQDDLTRTVRVLAIPPQRVGAKLVPEFLEDLTPPAEYDRAAHARSEHSLNRLASPGVRPDKRDRRLRDRFLDEVRRARPDVPPPDAEE